MPRNTKTAAGTYVSECDLCGRRWTSTGGSTGFVVAAHDRHKGHCQFRTPYERREHIKKGDKGKRKTRHHITAPIDHPGLVDRDPDVIYQDLTLALSKLYERKHRVMGIEFIDHIMRMEMLLRELAYCHSSGKMHKYDPVDF